MVPECVHLGHATFSDLAVTAILPAWFNFPFTKEETGSEEFRDLPMVSLSGRWSHWPL